MCAELKVVGIDIYFVFAFVLCSNLANLVELSLGLVRGRVIQVGLNVLMLLISRLYHYALPLLRQHATGKSQQLEI